MNPEAKALWLARIDEAIADEWFKLATHALRKGDDSYSVLGLLCDVFLTETWDGEWVKSRGLNDPPYFNYIFKVGEGPDSIAFSNLPGAVMKWAGLQESDPSLGGNDTFRLGLRGTTLEEFRELIEWNL
jgi:hypothetical protein